VVLRGRRDCVVSPPVGPDNRPKKWPSPHRPRGPRHGNGANGNIVSKPPSGVQVPYERCPDAREAQSPWASTARAATVGAPWGGTRERKTQLFTSRRPQEAEKRTVPAARHHSHAVLVVALDHRDPSGRSSKTRKSAKTRETPLRFNEMKQERRRLLPGSEWVCGCGRTVVVVVGRHSRGRVRHRGRGSPEAYGPSRAPGAG